MIRKYTSNFIMYVVMTFTIVVSLLPIVWVVMSSFKTNAEILGNPFALPTSFSFSPYAYLFSKYNFLSYMANSLFVSLTSTLASVVAFAMGSYVIAKYRFPFKWIIYALFTITLLVPSQSKAQPIFSLIMGLGLYDNLGALVLVYLSAGLAMSLFLLKNSFMSIPTSLDEAAFLEGAGFFTVFTRINLPLAKNGLMSAGILMFLGNWNEYFFASILTSSDRNRTLPLALQFFNEAFSYDYTKLFAALTVVVLPGIIIYAFTQEQVQTSVASTGMKG